MRNIYKSLAKLLNKKLKATNKLSETEWRVLECAISEEIDEEAKYWFLPVAQDMLYEACSALARDLESENPRIPAWRNAKHPEMAALITAIEDVKAALDSQYRQTN